MAFEGGAVDVSSIEGAGAGGRAGLELGLGLGLGLAGPEGAGPVAADKPNAGKDRLMM